MCPSPGHRDRENLIGKRTSSGVTLNQGKQVLRYDLRPYVVWNGDKRGHGRLREIKQKHPLTKEPAKRGGRTRQLGVERKTYVRGYAQPFGGMLKRKAYNRGV